MYRKFCWALLIVEIVFILIVFMGFLTREAYRLGDAKANGWHTDQKSVYYDTRDKIKKNIHKFNI